MRISRLQIGLCVFLLSVVASTVATQPPSDTTLRVVGNRLVDTCGDTLVVRGVEQVVGLGIDVGGSWMALVDQIAATGANAVRLLPDIRQLSPRDVDQILARVVSSQLIAFISPGARTWFNGAAVKAVLAKYTAWIILDAYQEPNFDDPVRWQNEAIAAVRQVRGYGYTVPLTVMANQFGRDLPTLIARGPAVRAADSQVIFGWQAYWGHSGFYQRHYGMTLSEGIQTAADQPFPVQLGLTTEADPGDPMDYQTALTVAAQEGLGWLFWNWYNPFGPAVFNLTSNGQVTGLTAAGTAVANTHPNGLSTAAAACVPGASAHGQ